MGWTIGKARSLLYGLAQPPGDVQAVWRGRVGKRLLRRAAGRGTARALGRLFR